MPATEERDANSGADDGSFLSDVSSTQIRPPSPTRALSYQEHLCKPPLTSDISTALPSLPKHLQPSASPSTFTARPSPTAFYQRSDPISIPTSIPTTPPSPLTPAPSSGSASTSTDAAVVKPSEPKPPAWANGPSSPLSPFDDRFQFSSDPESAASADSTCLSSSSPDDIFPFSPDPFADAPIARDGRGISNGSGTTHDSNPLSTASDLSPLDYSSNDGFPGPYHPLPGRFSQTNSSFSTNGEGNNDVLTGEKLERLQATNQSLIKERASLLSREAELHARMQELSARESGLQSRMAMLSARNLELESSLRTVATLGLHPPARTRRSIADGWRGLVKK